MRFRIIHLLLPSTIASVQIQVPFTGVLNPSMSSQDDLLRRLTATIPSIDKLMQIGGTAGISVGVMSHGEILLEHFFGFADLEDQRVANASTRYPLGSLTKSFVAATVAQLVHDGRLQWNEPITTYIPELSFASDPSLGKRLTLIDLLSHQTGLLRLDSLWLGANNEVVIPKNFTVAVCNHLSPVYPLRSQWLYNNWMYALVGEIIERVTHQSWGQVLASKVISKVGLSETTVIDKDIPSGLTALPYVVTDGKERLRIGDVELTDGTLMSPAGGLRATVGDLMKWGNTLISIFRNETPPVENIDIIMSGHAILNKSPASDELYTLGFAKVTTPTQFGKMGFNPGIVDTMPTLGTGSEPSRIFYHNGAIPGYNHCLVLVPGLQAVIVVLTNSISQGDIADWVAQTLIQAALDVKSPTDIVQLADKAATKWRTKYKDMAERLQNERHPDTPQASHQDFVGTYWHETRALSLRVYTDGEVLMFNINGKESQTHILSHYNYDSYIFLPSADERLKRALFHYSRTAWLLHFKRNKTGDVEEVTWNLDPQDADGASFKKAKGA